MPAQPPPCMVPVYEILSLGVVADKSDRFFYACWKSQSAVLISSLRKLQIHVRT